MSEFGSLLRRIRCAKGLVQKECAYYSDLERGRRHPPRSELLKKLADFLSADPVELQIAAFRERGHRNSVTLKSGE